VRELQGFIASPPLTHSVRYWNPKRAAAHRIATEAIKQSGAEKIRQLLESVASGAPIKAEMTKEAAPAGSSPPQVSDLLLPMKLKSLLDSDPGMFRMLKEEVDKFWPKEQQEEASSGGGQSS